MVCRTPTRSRGDQQYFTFRLVRSVRRGEHVKQQILLNLGAHFPLPKAHWKTLCQRITQILAPQPAWLDIETFPPVEAEAQRIAARLLQAEPSPLGPPSAARPATAEQPDFHALDVNSPHMTRPRSVGLEHVSLWAAQQLGLPQLPQQLGRSGPQRNAAPGLLIARMAAPASERATWIWLRERSPAGELLGCDFETVGLSALYRAGDRLLQHRKALESKLFARCAGLFDPAPTVTLVDLTNTFFEGSAQRQPLARPLAGEAQRLPAAVAGLDAGRERIRAACAGAGRQGERSGHPGGHAAGAGGSRGRGDGDGQGHCDGRERGVAAAQGVAVRGGEC